MKTFKSKSLTPDKTDLDIQNGVHTVKFISFESIVQLVKGKEKPIGYKVTEQGLTIVLN